MKKLLLSSLAVATLSLASLSASAAPVAVTFSPGFTVKVSLNPTCRVQALPAQSLAAADNVLDFGSYTSFATGPTTAAPNFTFTVECTRNLTTTAPTAAITNGNDGVVAGLNYSLAIATTPSAGTAAAPTGAAITVGNGTPTSYAYKVTGSMPGDQAGSVTAAVTDVRTLVITY